MRKVTIITTALFLAIAAFGLQSFVSVERTAISESPSLFGEPIASNWQVDGIHSNVNFSVDHLVISEVEGSFKVYSGSIETSGDDFSGAKIAFEVDVNSINTDNENRDTHLKSPDFFDAANHPKMSFTSSSFKKLKDNKYVLKGDLKIRDVTKKISFDVTFGGIAKDGYGNTKAGFKAKSTINRFDYGLKWNSVTEAGGLVVGEEVEIELKLQFAAAK